MEVRSMLSEDGRIIRVDNPWWSFYIDTKLAPELDKHRCGKWMFFFNDIEFVEEVCREAALGKVVAECKHSSCETLAKGRRGVACFYLNMDDEAHRRVIAFMLEQDLIRRTKSGKLFNIGFKLDDQTRRENMRPLSRRRSDLATLSTLSLASFFSNPAVMLR